MKLTRHNGRSGKNGVYNPLHNDRNFDVSNSDHIDEERSKQNIYWDCFNGFRQLKPKEDETLAETFADVEDLYYSARYQNHIEGQCARNEKNRHPERNRTTTDLRKNKKTCPEETLFQIGTIDNHVSGEVLVTVVGEFIAEWQERFGDYVHVLNWSLHMDEGTPHIHERHVFDCENQYGEIAPQQEKALEMLGFELPDPTKKPSKTNNRKVTFDSACRAMLFDICKKHGLQLEEEPEYGGRAYLEKQDYILMKQKEQLAKQGQTITEQKTVISEQQDIMAHQEETISEGFQKINDNRLTISKQNQKIDELTLKLDDVESLIDEVADVAYDKAVEVVADTVRVETHKEDIKMIKDTQEWLKSPERKAPKKERDYAVARLDGVIQKISKAMDSAWSKLKGWLTMPEVKEKGKEAIKNSARESIYAKLARGKAKADAENQARQNQKKQRKQNMEL